ncbi:hypothetical protein SAMN05421870_12033 [Streptomyces qinglanensis]|uniref:Uncharacterized protein n=1 Tax=Streptomyces qinglanensis TaxID=943816 RepID=A0A1H9WSK0_9ACTN|nr:hypothetical protein SAMN05421870_12033 [Streptomyces qinglanensis]
MSYDRDNVSPPRPGLRLLPWVTESGNPCFLSADDGTGVLAQLADVVQDEQLCDADAVRKDGQEVLGDSAADAAALRQALEASNRALTDALRVADSRGDRLADRETTESVCDDKDWASKSVADPVSLRKRSADGPCTTPG